MTFGRYFGTLSENAASNRLLDRAKIRNLLICITLSIQFVEITSSQDSKLFVKESDMID